MQRRSCAPFNELCDGRRGEGAGSGSGHAPTVLDHGPWTTRWRGRQRRWQRGLFDVTGRSRPLDYVITARHTADQTRTTHTRPPQRPVPRRYRRSREAKKNAPVNHTSFNKHVLLTQHRSVLSQLNHARKIGWRFLLSVYFFLKFRCRAMVGRQTERHRSTSSLYL